MTKLNIEKNKTVEMLQNEFTKLYPYLKIEFFKKPNYKGQHISKDRHVSVTEKLRNRNDTVNKNSIYFSSDTTVNELEKLFADNLGLSVQVYRKSGNIWLETTATSNWTLMRQNEEGKSLDEHLKIGKTKSNS